MIHADTMELMPGERVLWQGRPDWRVLARDVLRIRWVALYLAGLLIWGAYTDRSNGLGPGETLLAGVPLLVAGLLLLGACAAFAWGCARSTTYTVTTERCVMRFGMALTATLSLPLRSIAAVSVALNGDGTGDIPLALKPGQRVAWRKLWPHARPWRFSKAEPMLRGVRNAAQVGALLGHAIDGVAPGRFAALPAARAWPVAAMARLVPSRVGARAAGE